MKLYSGPKVEDSIVSVKETCNQTFEENPCPCWKFVSTSGNMRGRIKDRLSEYVGLFENHFERPEIFNNEEGVYFDERSGLGKDVYAIVQRFLKGDLKWIHAMVKSNAFETFVRELKPIRDQFLVLPFWCLCDGLLDCEGNKCVHRHMIIAYEPESEFEYIWKHKVRMPLPNKNEKSKFCVKITKASHLVWTIHYASRPNSSCDKGISENLDFLSDENLNALTSHFCINRTMHPHAIAFLSMRFENGIVELLWRQLGDKDIYDWENDAVRYWDENRNMKFSVPIRITNWKFKNCVVPLDSKFEPCDEETRFWLTWYKNKHMYLKVNPEYTKMPRKKWYSTQIQKGNTFQCIQNELYVLSPRQQSAMNQIKRHSKRMKAEMDSYWSDRYEKMVAKKEALISKEREMFAKERDKLKTEILQLKTENSLLKQIDYIKGLLTTQ
ncbi:hypothetical protein HNY73_007641 [Argiope bruennichi]|uniref:Uncharacterized protein n=1 Tax=Argiope bruennichi TaxID=94029 RepID=A0A8T0FH43_ARGBR|nr:hypothetical protein HNY73_007641 [Argiope bruennichi]